MAKIGVLEKQVAQLIAAGEVVERPASIAKELVENALDAGATSITVEIKGGGISFLRVSDNGEGIAREDVPRAFLRHATSKIRTGDDLDSIMTMGFRGEALASIAAMCRVELLTRIKEEVAGTFYRVDGGEAGEPEDAGCPVGTTITVRDVFFNTPARMKFLKKDTSEGAQVTAVAEKAALGNPDVAIKLIRDGVTKFQTPGDGNVLSCARVILGKEFTEGAISVNYECEGLSLHGLICKPEIARASRSLQNFFINRRYVRSRTCLAALEEAYRNMLMTGRFPGCVLNLSIPAQTVDVNVHPAKIEVRFTNEKRIFELVYYGCKTALGTAQLAPEISVTPARPVMEHRPLETVKQLAFETQESKTARTPVPEAARREYPQPQYFSAPLPDAAAPSVANAQADSLIYSEPPKQRFDLRSIDIETDDEPVIIQKPVIEHPQPKPENGKAPMEPPQAAQSALFSDIKLLGEAFDTYILLQNSEGIVVVDKHAAHERLIFNRLMEQGVGGQRQLLLAPVSVRLSPAEYTAVLDQLETVEKMGLLVEDFGGNTVIIREAAPVLSGADLKNILTELAAKLAQGKGNLTLDYLEELYHIMACRAAVKAHDKTPPIALEELIKMLWQDSDATHCPHGRPVAMRITKHELEKKFGRLG